MISKKNSILVTILVLVMGFVFIFGVIAYGYVQNSKKTKLFVTEKEGKASKIYNEIINLDLDSNYPTSDEAVMDLNNNIMYLIYGDVFINSDNIDELVKIQRKLYSKELLENNDLDTQVENIFDSLDVFKNKGLYTVEVRRENMNYSYKDNNISTAIVKQFLNKNITIVWEYSLIKDEQGKWQINSWLTK